MTSSRSSGSISRLLGVALLLLVLLTGSALAEKRRRVVVLPFEGDAKTAEKFHKAVVKLIKKSHTVVSATKWESTASNLSAEQVTDGNIKKVAKKLRVDGVLEGKVEKKKNQYVVKLKLHAGKSGAVVGSLGGKLDDTDLTDELIAAVDKLPSVRKTADEDEAEPEGESRFGKASGKDKGEDAVAPPVETPKQVAAAVEAEPEVVVEKKPEAPAASKTDGARATEKLTPGERALDVTVGVSFNARDFAWNTASDLPGSMGVPNSGKPPDYKGAPAAGVHVDLRGYPLAIGHKTTGIWKDLGLHFMFDRALLISSELDGEKLDTVSVRYLAGASFRYPLGKSAVVGATLAYGSQKFEIAPGSDLPNAGYTMIAPGVFAGARLPFFPKLTVGAKAAFLLISDAGQITEDAFYGNASINGLDAELDIDYAIKPAIFARAAVTYETIGYTFDGDGMLSTGRDVDPEQDIFGARDNYLGVSFSVGYLY